MASLNGLVIFSYAEKVRKYKLVRWGGAVKLTAIYEKAAEGGYIGYVAELPGANTQGETIEETRENLKEAVSLLLDCYREDAEERFGKAVDAMKEELVLQAV